MEILNRQLPVGDVLASKRATIVLTKYRPLNKLFNQTIEQYHGGLSELTYSYHLNIIFHKPRELDYTLRSDPCDLEQDTEKNLRATIV